MPFIQLGLILAGFYIYSVAQICSLAEVVGNEMEGVFEILPLISSIKKPLLFYDRTYAVFSWWLAVDLAKCFVVC